MQGPHCKEKMLSGQYIISFKVAASERHINTTIFCTMHRFYCQRCKLNAIFHEINKGCETAMIFSVPSSKTKSLETNLFQN